MIRDSSISIHEKLNTFLFCDLAPSSSTSTSSVVHFNPGISEFIVSRTDSGALEFRQHSQINHLDNNEYRYVSTLKDYVSRFDQIRIDRISFGTHFCVFTCQDSSSIFACGLQNIYQKHNNNHKLCKNEKDWIQLITSNIEENVMKISVGEMHCLLSLLPPRM